MSQLLESFFEELSNTKESILSVGGKGYVRFVIKLFYGENYSLKQVREFFKNHVLEINKKIYTIKT